MWTYIEILELKGNLSLLKYDTSKCYLIDSFQYF